MNCSVSEGKALVRLRFPLGKSGKPFSAVTRSTYRFRELVERELPDMTVLQAHRLATACRAFRAAARCHVLMTKLGAPPEGALTVEQWLGLQDREIRHSESVDRALRDLGLDGDSKDKVFELLYGQGPVIASTAKNSSP